MSSLKLEQQHLDGKIIIVTLDGDLAGEYVKLVECVLQGILAYRTRLVLYLSDVQTIAPSGLQLLQRLVGKGVVLRGSGLCTQHLIERMMTDGTVH